MHDDIEMSIIKHQSKHWIAQYQINLLTIRIKRY